VQTTPRQIIESSVPQTCLAAGASLHDRDGRTIAAHYGSVPGELAVCMKSVGLADRSDIGVFELHGDQGLLDRALVNRLGDPPLAPRNARRMRSVWYIRQDPRRLLLVGPHPALASGPPIGKGHDRTDLPHKDIGAGVRTISLIGPRAARLLSAAGLPGDLAIGAVARDPDDPDIIAILRESPRRFLALVRTGGADALWARLLVAGEPLGAAFVGFDALTLLGPSGSND